MKQICDRIQNSGSDVCCQNVFHSYFQWMAYSFSDVGQHLLNLLYHICARVSQGERVRTFQCGSIWLLDEWVQPKWDGISVPCCLTHWQLFTEASNHVLLWQVLWNTVQECIFIILSYKISNWINSTQLTDTLELEFLHGRSQSKAKLSL
jgi:hypothetical protein